MDVLWQALAKVIEAIFTRPENVALLLSVAVNFSLGYFILQMRKEDRADRMAMTEALKVNADAINSMRLVVAAALGNAHI